MNYLGTSTETSHMSVSMTNGKEEACEVLANILRTGVDVHRCAAAQALGTIEFQGAIAPLLEALRDEDEDVRTDAATALAHYSSEQVATELLNNLIGDPNMDVKAAAIDGLVAMKDANVIPWLRKMVVGRDTEIFWDEDQYYQDGWDSWVDIQLKSIIGLAALGDEGAVPIITAAIDDEMGQDLSEAGFKSLAALGQPGVDALAEYLKSGSEKIRRRAALSLGLADVKLAAPVLRAVLNDDSVDVRLSAVRVLAAFDLADPALKPLFVDQSQQVRALMARLTGAHYPDELHSLINDPDPQVRIAVMKTLEENPDLATDGVSRVWVGAELQGNNIEVAVQAARLTGVLHPTGAFEDLSLQLANTKRAEPVRLAVVNALVALNDDRAVEELRKYIGDPSRQVRMDVMVALSRLSRSEHSASTGKEILLAALRGELVAAPEPEGDETGQQQVSPESGKDADKSPAAPVPDEAPVSTLQAILGDNSPELKVLKREGDKVELSQRDIEFLGLAQKKLRKRKVSATPEVAPHQDVRRFAARVLGDLSSPEVVDALTLALNDEDTEVSVTAADSLVRLAESGVVMTEPTRNALVVLTEQSNRALRLSGIRALGLARVSEHFPALENLLSDSDSYVRTDAVRSCALLGEFPEQGATLLKDADASTRLAAAQALAKVKGKECTPMLVDFAFLSEGYHRKEAAQLLRELDQKMAADGFLRVLNDSDRRREWQVSIEALATLFEDAPQVSGISV